LTGVLPFFSYFKLKSKGTNMSETTDAINLIAKKLAQLVKEILMLIK
jgi:hypothetical protein